MESGVPPADSVGPEREAGGPLLALRGVDVSFPAAGSAPVKVVRGLDLELGPGEALGLVGESGCGKSLTALAILGLIPRPGSVAAGEVLFRGRDLLRVAPTELRTVRGREIGMVFQEPAMSLNPVLTVGTQLAEALQPLGNPSRAVVADRSAELLAELGVPEPRVRLRAYPGELSGGLRQRVMIAAAAACRPALLIADEPTTALDVTVQAQIMALLGELRKKHGMALLLITHDLGLVAHHVDRVAVMYCGRVVETAPTRSLFAAPLHPYTRGLLASVPGTGVVGPGQRLRAIPGSVPAPANLPCGCSFRDRCDVAAPECAREEPPLAPRRAGRWVRCLRVPADV